MGRNQYWAGRVYDFCVYYMTGTPEGSTKSGFMEKPGIEPATPGLQGIALIHYTTGASLKTKGFETIYNFKLKNIVYINLRFKLYSFERIYSTIQLLNRY